MSGLTKAMVDIRAYLENQDFTGLLIDQLGWDNPGFKQKIKLRVEGSNSSFEVTPVASKKGMTIFHCPTFPTRKEMAEIDREVSRRSLERMIIFTEEGSQIWRWPEPRKAGGTRFVNHEFVNGNPSESLVQRLAAIAFTFEEEKNLNILRVLERVRSAFNSEEVTNKFYKEFEDNQKALAEEIKGIHTEDDRSWYSSLLLNRLMFIYFMQRKGFLNDDPHYLRSSLISVRDLKGKNKFYFFYKDFLLPLFHDGLGSEDPVEVDPEMARIIGDVPYVNGGIFAQHELEKNNKITIPDEAFERIFTFFDRYRWHLDERESAEPGEINPDVLGYIFEKYVNQKQQGAYYTKEDVTGYMSVNTILPVVIDRVSLLVGDTPWAFISDQPFRYISESMRFGLEQEIPAEISSLPLSEYGALDELSDPSVGLPGERWRETRDRLDYVETIAGRIRSGAISSTSEAIDLNLDLTTLFVDWVASFTDADHIAHAWQTLIELNVLDPTCGSGAFLFAAMDVLEELYEVVIRRASEILTNGKDTKNGDLKRITDDITRHPSPKYFLLKTIVLENIYGVDIMAEAIEIARLRLFLSLVARLQNRSEIEPLPDLDMNIKVGNNLVGCSTFEDAELKFAGNLLAISALDELKPKAANLVSVYNKFVEVQRVTTSGSKLAVAKKSLVDLSSEIREELDELYASENQVPKKDFEKWKKSHIPFHWFVEFPEAITKGGFDVVIGNPPYINRTKVTQYKFGGFETDKSPDIYAICMERSTALVSHHGAFAMIIPISFEFSSKYETIRRIVGERLPMRIASTFTQRPSSLFDAEIRPMICIGHKLGVARLSTSGTQRWQQDFRPHLFETLRFGEVKEDKFSDPWPRIGSVEISNLYSSLVENNKCLGIDVSQSGYRLGFKQTGRYFLSLFIEDPPSWNISGKRVPQTKVGDLYFIDESSRNIAFIMLSGRLSLWWWGATGDDFDVTSKGLKSFPIAVNQLQPIADDLLELAEQLQKRQWENPLVSRNASLYIGNFDMRKCRDITDKADQLILSSLGLGNHWSDILLVDAKMAKAKSETGEERREWPFPL